ncbi:MAG: hypothetical protein ACI93T_003668 [Porticoccaceae bacterium]|jgi:hypothetical protein
MSDKHQRQHQPPSLDDIKDRPLFLFAALEEAIEHRNVERARKAQRLRVPLPEYS